MTDAPQSPANPPLACVTGASGFIGSHLVRDLLDRGFRVRATVRDHTDERKTAHLRLLEAKRPGTLEIISANLLDPAPWDAAVANCDYVFHIASAVILAADNPQIEIVDPAVKGTEHVFAAITRAGCVKGVGLTSSIAAIISTEARPDHTFTEEDWVEDATLETNPYGLAKKLAEKAAWRACESLPLDVRYNLMVVNPVLVLGPAYAKAHLRSSLSLIRDLMRGSFKGAPNLGFGVVDVREVTDALVGGVLAGKTGRFILHNEFMFMRDIALIIRNAFPRRKVPTRRLPNFVMYAAAVFDKRMSWAFLRRNLGRRSKIDNSKVKRELGISFRPVSESIIDTCKSFEAHNYV